MTYYEAKLGYECIWFPDTLVLFIAFAKMRRDNVSEWAASEMHSHYFLKSALSPTSAVALLKPMNQVE